MQALGSTELCVEKAPRGRKMIGPNVYENEEDREIGGRREERGKRKVGKGRATGHI